VVWACLGQQALGTLNQGAASALAWLGKKDDVAWMRGFWESDGPLTMPKIQDEYT
jgi:hypothetical protein